MQVKFLIFIVWILFSPNLCKAQIWRDVGGGCDIFNGQGVKGLFAFNNLLYVAGDFNNVNGVPISALGFTIWDSTNWLNTNTTFNNTGYPTCFTTYNNELYMAGFFNKINGNAYCNDIAKYDGNNWVPLGSGITNGFGVKTMIEYGSDLFVGGNFTIVDSTINAKRIARWDGSQWHAMGTGFTGGITIVYSMAVYNSELYVGGMFSSVDGLPVNNICKWNGTSWDSLGPGINGLVRSFVVDTINNVLYVGGLFNTAGSVSTPTGVAEWNGSSWSAVGNMPFLSPVSMCMYKNKLFVGGAQSGIINNSGDSIDEMAWFNGVEWIPACKSTDGGEIEAMAVYNDELYVGGYFQQIDDSVLFGIARTYFPNVKVDAIEINESDIDVYPNPANDELLVSLDKSPISFQYWKLMNIQGKSVLHGKTSKSFNINISDIKAGNYLLLLESDKKIVRTKSVIIVK